MVDQSAFQVQGSAGGGGSSTFYTKDKNGAVVEVEITREQFKAPSPGFYHLRLKALGAPYEDTKSQFPGMKVRAVFMVKAPGTANDKRLFSQPLTIAKRDKATGGWRSNITGSSGPGQMIGAMRGRPVGEGEQLNLLDFLNGEFQAMVNQTTKTSEQYGVETYGNIVKDTWKPLGQQTMPEPAPVAAAASVSAAPNPFLADDDE